MRSVFEDHEIGWEGKTYTIPADRMLRVIASVEDVVTYGELLNYAARKSAPFGKLARAYSIVLRAAGVPVTDDEVYLGMLRDGESVDLTLSAINGLFALMVPPSMRGQDEQGGGPPRGNSRKGAQTKKASSKPSTKR